MPQRTGRTASNTLRDMLAIGFCIVLALMAAAPSAWAKRPPKTISTANGSPIRKVYIYTDSPVTADSAVTQLTQDTCLTVVTQPKEADAILQFGMVLPMVAENGGGLGGSDTSGHRKKHKNRKNGDRGVSVTCGDGSSDCGSLPTGAVGPEQNAKWTGNVGGNEDVTLVSTVSEADELWAPDTRKKQSWSDQLRMAVGCPVCPGERFDPRRDGNYQTWIQAKCPGVLAGNK